jgi:peptide-methionine (S)-S-oxide reductase
MWLAAAMGCAVPGAWAGAATPAPEFDPPVAGGPQMLVLAGGCFWCVEAVFEQLEGVTDVVSGYAGGTAETAHYEMVGAGGTDHAESVRITYDPARISLGKLLQVFFSTHEPTVLNRQGPDAGPQYRAAIFPSGEFQEKVARAYIRQLTASRTFGAPIATSVEPLKAFFPAEAYHQDYVALHPDHPYVRAWSVPRVNRTRELFPALLKKRK